MDDTTLKKKPPRDPALRARFWRLWHRSQGYGRRYIPPGLRFLAGFLLIILGMLGFLPVLGFWMIPLGIAIAALDVKAALILLTAWRQKRADEKDTRIAAARPAQADPHTPTDSTEDSPPPAKGRERP